MSKVISKDLPQRDMQKEGKGWLTMALMLLLYPALFYLCVFFPIWVGWTPRW